MPGGTAMSLRAALATAAVVALAAAPAAHAGAGAIDVTATERLSPRLVDLTMTTPALAEPVHARILLPTGYRSHPKRRYPVLMLLHGGFGSYVDWTESGDAEAITKGVPVITVMPEDGNGGWNVDWYNGGRGGPPRWETYDVRQLLPWVEDRYRAIGTRAGRAVAGLSTGGFGAISLASRNPDLFAFAASFSGAVDIVGNPFVPAVIGAEAAADGAQPTAPFGDRVANEIVWRAHNPVDLAANLRGMRLVVDTGNGEPGPYDQPGAPPDVIEQQVHSMSETFHERLLALGIDHRYDDYGPGTHSWAYWQRDLREALPKMMRTFKHPRPAPRPFTYTSAEARYRVYGWRVSLDRPAQEFSTLARARRHGFELTGRGEALVRTAALYRPRSRHEVTVAGGRETMVRADRAGRLEVEFPLSRSTPATARVTIAG